MKSSHIFPLLLIAGMAGYIAGHVVYSTPAKDKPYESVYERVLRTHKWHCGYFEEPPFTMVDPNTGVKSGIAIDLAEKIAGDLNLKIDWQPVANFTTVGEDLRHGRFDAICGSYFNLPRAGSLDYTIPYAYEPLYAYARTNRQDLDIRLDALDWSRLTIAGLDGEGSTAIAQKKFPQAKFDILPQLSQIGVMLTSVADKKADIAFVSPPVFSAFDKTNPGKLRRVATPDPFYIYAVSFALKPGESAFKDMLDYMIRSYIASGEMDDLFHRYDPDKTLLRPWRPTAQP